MSVIPSGFAEVSMSWSIPGTAGPAYTVFGVSNDGPFTASEIAEKIALQLASATNKILSYVDSSVLITNIRVIANIAGVEVFWDEPVSLAGLEAGTSTPPQVAMLMRKQSGIVGRKYQGRMYLPGCPNDVIDEGGFLNSTWRSGLSSAGTEFLADLSGENIPMVILHTDVETAPTEVSALFPSEKVATQRRRLR